MLVAQIDRALEVNGHLFNAVALAAALPTINEAEAALRSACNQSRIYRVVRETPETVAVFSQFHRHPLAHVGAE